jgi:hypothetical protein
VSRLAGTELPTGSFTITVADQADLVAALGCEAGGDPHPIWAFIAMQRGIGIGVAELCALADFDVDDGPMLGSVELTYSAPLELGVEYTVTGEVVGLERKHGRKAGTFDVLTFRERLLAPGGTEVATTTNTMILPRRKA